MKHKYILWAKLTSFIMNANSVLYTYTNHSALKL
jgi:hypothetical protein